MQKLSVTGEIILCASSQEGRNFKSDRPLQVRRSLLSSQPSLNP
ncbi:hypothetical protein PQG02_00950 [Nostoc sp. UHCC 0926]|nr:hypothetical protein PQG02_00950 [Nostoc sp. UHCC 0926]